MMKTLSDAQIKFLGKCKESPMGHRIAAKDNATSQILEGKGLIVLHDKDPSLAIITDEGEDAVGL